VLKGCRDPYIPYGGNRVIKLKKDYIPGLGDTADLVVIAGSRNAADEQDLGLGKLWWTSFYIACLDNKEDVCRFNAKPRFRIIDQVGRHGISKDNMLFLNRHGSFERVPFTLSRPELDVSFGQQRPSRPIELFKRPFMVEVTGAGFDKPSDTSYFTLRFPRILKIHQDRTIKETVSYDELQETARLAMKLPTENKSDEERAWFKKLKQGDSQRNYTASQSTNRIVNDDRVCRTVAGTGRVEAAGPSNRRGSALMETREVGIVTASKRKVLLESSLPHVLAAKRTKISSLMATDDEAI
jgi:DNA ligase-4